MPIIDYDLGPITVKELRRGYGLLTRSTPKPRPQPVQDAIDSIAAELSKKGYILCNCESGNRRQERFDDQHNFIFWGCEACDDDKWHDYHKRG